MELANNPNKLTFGLFIRCLLVCGILAQLSWIIMDIIASFLYKDYSYLHQAISELTAIGSPVKALLIITNSYVFTPLYLAFGVGVFLLGKQKKQLRMIGILIMVQFVLSMVSILFPINTRGNDMGLNGMMHSIIYSLIPIIYMVNIVIGSRINGKIFFTFSVITVILVFIGFILTGLAVPKIIAGLDTPWLGVYERINAYGAMIWIIILILVLFHQSKS